MKTTKFTACRACHTADAKVCMKGAGLEQASFGQNTVFAIKNSQQLRIPMLNLPKNMSLRSGMKAGGGGSKGSRWGGLLLPTELFAIDGLRKPRRLLWVVPIQRHRWPRLDQMGHKTKPKVRIL